MSATVQQIAEQAMALPVEERAALVDKLWESLEDTTYPPLSAAWQEEIERRRRALADGTARSVPGEEVSRQAWELIKPVTPWRAILPLSRRGQGGISR